MDEVALRENPGDLLVHDAIIIHRADAKPSAHRLRRAHGFVYYGKRGRADAVAPLNINKRWLAT